MPNTPSAHLHHVHLFASDLEKTVTWYVDNLAAEVVFDGEFGGDAPEQGERNASNQRFAEHAPRIANAGIRELRA